MFVAERIDESRLFRLRVPILADEFKGATEGESARDAFGHLLLARIAREEVRDDVNDAAIGFARLGVVLAHLALVTLAEVFQIGDAIKREDALLAHEDQAIAVGQRCFVLDVRNLRVEGDGEL
ncbi:MAG: hypothetical protein JMDDDDMK_03310 [Acidobacteria bacterium]|nr:hypothetical protein [Acidobacteriota bacterium]